MLEKDKVVWWIAGGICFIAGLSSFYNGNYRVALEAMGLSLVFIAAGSEEFRETLTAYFYSIYKKFLKVIIFKN